MTQPATTLSVFAQIVKYLDKEEVDIVILIDPYYAINKQELLLIFLL